MTFYNRLVEATQEQRNALYSVPQLVAALKGDISRDMYVAYLTQAYHHVKHTVPFLMSMGAHLPKKNEWLRSVLVEYLEEEIGHEEWILNDIEAAGGDKELARESKPYLLRVKIQWGFWEWCLCWKAPVLELLPLERTP